jgi:hypothetical protein
MKMVKGFEVYGRENENDEYQSFGIFETEFQAKSKLNYVYSVLEIDDVVVIESEFVDTEPKDEELFMMVDDYLLNFDPRLN